MMGDDRVATQPHHQRATTKSNNSNNNNDVDMLIHSESPQIQEFRLYRELSKEIEKSSHDRVRYVDSDIYLRAGGGGGVPAQSDRYSVPSGSSETQSATINISTTPHIGGKLRPNQSPVKSGHEIASSTTTANGTKETPAGQSSSGNADDRIAEARAINTLVDGNCQVCLIKELKDDLTNVTRLLQERNEQLTSKLKAKRLRTFFERQMLD